MKTRLSTRKSLNSDYCFVCETIHSASREYMTVSVEIGSFSKILIKEIPSNDKIIQLLRFLTMCRNELPDV